MNSIWENSTFHLWISGSISLLTWEEHGNLNSVEHVILSAHKYKKSRNSAFIMLQ